MQAFGQHVLVLVALIAVARALVHGSLRKQGHDKCMKHLWPDVVDSCGGPVVYHGSCEQRVAHFATEYQGSCAKYCDSIGLQCESGKRVTEATGCEGEWHSCDATIVGSEAVCACRDTCDTFLWADAQELCGACSARISNLSTSYANSCEDYCAGIGMHCDGAAVADNETCGLASNASCTDHILGTADAVCQCGGEYSRGGVHNWPHKKDICSSTSVLVDGRALADRFGGTCEGYCKGLGGQVLGREGFHFACFQQDLAPNGTCSQSTMQADARCTADTRGVDAICSCSFADRRVLL